MRNRILCFLPLLLLLWAGAAYAESADTAISCLSDLNGKRIGVTTGTTFDAIVLKALPDAKTVYINFSADLIAALEAGKIDGFAVDEPAAKQFCAENPRLTMVDEYLDTFEFGVVLPKTAKGDALLEELNAWLVPMKESGALDRVIEKWAYGPEEEKTLPDYAAFPAAKGTLTLATEGDYVPMTYYRGSEIVGAEIDLIAQFCEANGYGLKVQVMNFDGILPAVQAGKVDFAAAGISITDERRESVNFSAPYYSGGTVVVVLKSKLAAKQTAERTQSVITSFADLEHARIGVMTGSIQVLQAEERFPDAELFYFTTDVDMLNALRANKIDAFASAEVLVNTMMKENADLTYLDGWLGGGMKAAAIFPKTESGQALCDQFSAFIREIRQNGVYEEIQEIWFGEDEAKQVIPDLYELPATNGTLRMAADTSVVPFVYIKNGRPVGIEIDTVVRFCKEYGYGLEVVPMDFSGVIPSVVTGKVDFASCGIAITEERAESVLFSEPTYETGSVLAVLKTEETVAPAEENTSFWDGIVSSFNKTFIRENRWELFVNGVLTTLLITVLSILFGTALGFAVFMLCRNGNIVANGVTRFFMWLVQGMPMVVLLMILYYIIFGSVAISGIFVAVIGFTLTFGGAVFGLLKMGVGAIDRGQYEAAYALGYANRRIFFRIILPQAIPHILPAYKGEIVGLIKATAIVGYIAVQDLTKMGDIVRSRTYEAFFPLIAVTVIYFVLEGLLGFLVSKIQIRMNPKKRKPENILKGDKPPTTASGRNIVGGGISRNEQCPHEAGLRQLRQRESMIKIEHLKKVYPNVIPLKDVSVEINDGDVISVIGPSGTGKSTLLRCINQLEKATDGHIWVDGVDVTDPKCDLGRMRQKMGMVFQSFNLFGHLTVIENIMLAPMDLLGKSKQEAYDEGMRLLRTVGLAEKALNYPDELSGGQKQRIAIARTLAMNPEVILFDEPTSALDPTMVGEVQAVIRDLSKTGKTLMIVTHEMNFARAISNRVFYMDEGGIYEDGSPEQIFDHPQRENTRRFIRKLKVLELNIENKDYDFLGMDSEIDQYCNKNQIPCKMASRIHLAFEELVQQMLVPALVQPDIQSVIEYSEAEENAVLTVRYNGPAFDVTAQGNELSLMVLKSAVSDMAYTWDESKKRPNQAVLRIRKA